jgi:hypothetical protein
MCRFINPNSQVSYLHILLLIIRDFWLSEEVNFPFIPDSQESMFIL